MPDQSRTELEEDLPIVRLDTRHDVSSTLSTAN